MPTKQAKKNLQQYVNKHADKAQQMLRPSNSATDHIAPPRTSQRPQPRPKK